MIRVTWETLTESEFVEGFFVRFRDMSGGSQKFNMKTVMLSEGEDSSNVISNLRKFTEYEVFLMPFYKKLEGQPSNSLHVQTLADVPSAPPGNVRADMINVTSAEIKWAPPPPQHRNGVLLGYQIHVKGNGSAFHSNVTLNATTTHYVLTNLSLNEDYSVRTCALTNAGHGPFSDAVAFRMDPALVKYPIISHPDANVGNLIGEPWFVALLGGIILALVLSFMGIVLYRRQWSQRKSLGHLAVPVQRYEDMHHSQQQQQHQSETVWINGNWKQGTLDINKSVLDGGSYYKDGNASQDLYAEVGDCDDIGAMSTFNFSTRSTSDPAAPYATTTLAMQNKMRTLNGSTFVSLPQHDNQQQQERNLPNLICCQNSVKKPETEPVNQWLLDS
jgi:roundabout axon guidance receptor 2